MSGYSLPPRQSLARELSLQDEEIDLASAALCIAAEEYPGLDSIAYLGRIAQYAQRVKVLLRGRHNYYDAIHALNTVLFDEEGFHGNSEDYYNPLNSYLNEVMERRTGIPITLSVLYMEVARRSGQRLRGIGMPSHFIVAAGQGPSEIYVDPYNRGALLSRKEAAAMALRGKEPPNESMAALVRRLLPVYDRRSILRRILNNLKQIYTKENDALRALRTAECMQMIEPGDWRNLSDLARLQTELGRFTDAANSLSAFIERAPAGVDVRLAENALRQLRALAASGEPQARQD